MNTEAKAVLAEVAASVRAGKKHALVPLPGTGGMWAGSWNGTLVLLQRGSTEVYNEGTPQGGDSAAAKA